MVNQKVKLSQKPPGQQQHYTNQTIGNASHTNVSQLPMNNEEMFEISRRDQSIIENSDQMQLKRKDSGLKSQQKIPTNLEFKRSLPNQRNSNKLQKIASNDDTTIQPIIIIPQRPQPILTKIFAEAWLWEKEQSHRLFNFHDGFRVYDQQLEIIGSSMILKKGQSDIYIKKASMYQDKQNHITEQENDEDSPRKNNILVNVIHHQGDYHLFEPQNKNASKFNIIDNHLWLITKFMPNKAIEVKEGDVIRFGRIPFKIAQMHLDENAPINDNSMFNISNNDVSQPDITNFNINPPEINYQNNRADGTEMGDGLSAGPFGRGQHDMSSNNLLVPNRNHSNNNVSQFTVNATTFHEDMSFNADNLHRLNEQMDNQAAANKNEPPQISFGKGLKRPNDKFAGGLKDNMKGVGLESGKACRICLDDSEEEGNPFITPCKCAGSMKFIHLQCLREWLDSKKVQQKLEGVYSYYWEELVCELCKEPLALNNISVSNKNKTYYLLNFKQPKNKQYLVLESDIECLSKAIHVIVFTVKPDFYVGRRINNDITVSDISVSRNQASIRLKDGKVYVEDCESKFGTFVKIKGPIQVPRVTRLPIQIEKKCFFIQLTQRYSCMESCFLSCGIGSNSEQFDHFKDVKEKFPKELQEVFLPKTLAIKGGKFPQNYSQKQGYNRVMDESVISQITGVGGAAHAHKKSNQQWQIIRDSISNGHLKNIHSGAMVIQDEEELHRGHTDIPANNNNTHQPHNFMNSGNFKGNLKDNNLQEIQGHHKNSSSNPFYSLNKNQQVNNDSSNILPPIDSKNGLFLRNSISNNQVQSQSQYGFETVFESNRLPQFNQSNMNLDESRLSQHSLMQELAGSNNQLEHQLGSFTKGQSSYQNQFNSQDQLSIRNSKNNYQSNQKNNNNKNNNVNYFNQAQNLKIQEYGDEENDVAMDDFQEEDADQEEDQEELEDANDDEDEDNDDYQSRQEDSDVINNQREELKKAKVKKGKYEESPDHEKYSFQRDKLQQEFFKNVNRLNESSARSSINYYNASDIQNLKAESLNSSLNNFKSNFDSQHPMINQQQVFANQKHYVNNSKNKQKGDAKQNVNHLIEGTSDLNLDQLRQQAVDFLEQTDQTEIPNGLTNIAQSEAVSTKNANNPKNGQIKTKSNIPLQDNLDEIMDIEESKIDETDQNSQFVPDGDQSQIFNQVMMLDKKMLQSISQNKNNDDEDDEYQEEVKQESKRNHKASKNIIEVVDDLENSFKNQNEFKQRGAVHSNDYLNPLSDNKDENQVQKGKKRKGGAAKTSATRHAAKQQFESGVTNQGSYMENGMIKNLTAVTGPPQIQSQYEEMKFNSKRILNEDIDDYNLMSAMSSNKQTLNLNQIPYNQSQKSKQTLTPIDDNAEDSSDQNNFKILKKKLDNSKLQIDSAAQSSKHSTLQIKQIGTENNYNVEDINNKIIGGAVKTDNKKGKRNNNDKDQKFSLTLGYNEEENAIKQVDD